MDFVKGPGNHPEARISRMVKTYEKDLLRLCCMYLKDTVMAEDAVQETFLKAYKSLHAFRGESSEKTWLMRIAINVCKDMQRTAWFRNLGKMVSIENVQIPTEQEMSISSELVSEIMKLPSTNSSCCVKVSILSFSIQVNPQMTCFSTNKGLASLK